MVNLNACTVDDLAGTWNLVGYGTFYLTFAPGLEGLNQEEYDEAADDTHERWLDGHPELLPDITDRSGLVTTISGNSIVDSGDLEGLAYWEDNGIQGACPFEGKLEEINGRVFAFSDEFERNGLYQRVENDGCYVTDEFFTDNDKMVRVMTVLFDEINCYRSIFVLEKTAAHPN